MYKRQLEGKAYEAGVKGEFLEGRLNASAAVFQVNQDNLAQEDTGYLIPGTINQAYRATKGTSSRGFDLELSGGVSPGWNVAAGWSPWTARDGPGSHCLLSTSDQVLWGSDWPFVRMGAAAPSADALVAVAQRWLGDDATRRKVWVDNPARLYGFA